MIHKWLFIIYIYIYKYIYIYIFINICVKGSLALALPVGHWIESLKLFGDEGEEEEGERKEED